MTISTNNICKNTDEQQRFAELNRILQGTCKATDCKIEYMLIMKSKNNEVTARLPTIADVLLDKNPIPLALIPVIRDPNDFAEKTEITGLINQKVKDLFEREKATSQSEP